ncbi:ornithine cyclodeaminase family protein [Brevibacterium sp. 'Marine']|uniref:ornithine cyclodeaminase family protein n=1 Tax=unclassified Brevibacterium TaxID=2614124 RepID=UPI00145D3CD8|nr:ornithine cyclodeaminase family protein [Brevibacterium sp. 'Marine']
MLILTRSDLEALVDTDATIASLREVLSRQSESALTVAPHALRLDDDSAFVPMIGADLVSDIVTSKTLMDSPKNARLGLPSQRSAITVIDRNSGEVRAILHGGVPTRVRTAGVSAVATDALARPEASVLGLIGAGALAVEHVRAVNRVRPLETVVVWSRTRESMQRFHTQLEKVWNDGTMPRVSNASAPEDVVSRSEIICTLTPSVTPVVKGSWLRPGQHINVVGARPRPTDREVDADAFDRSQVFVDHLDTVAHESGDYLLARGEDGRLPEIVSELSRVLRGEVAGRRTSEDITLYNSVGVGLQDTAIVNVILEAAAASKAGTVVDIDA